MKKVILFMFVTLILISITCTDVPEIMCTPTPLPKAVFEIGKDGKLNKAN